MTYNLDQLKEMVPIYLNGRLSDKERVAFDDGLERFAELKKELAEFSDIQQSYAQVEQKTTLDSDALFARIQDNIQKQEVLAPKQQSVTWFQQLQQKLRDWYHAPALSWSLAGAQFAALLVVLMVVPHKGQQFQTYTAPPTQKDGIHINAVFNEGATEIEIRTLLQQVGATIVDGPTSMGLYVLQFDASADVNVLIQQLIDSKIVRIAEKTLSGLERPYGKQDGKAPYRALLQAASVELSNVQYSDC